MPNVLLILDFLIPAILFFSGRAMKGDLGRKLQKESIFVLIVAALFAPILLGRLRIPHIIGMILAGVVVGKYGLNILERDSSFELFGKVGIYYIMFL